MSWTVARAVYGSSPRGRGTQLRAEFRDFGVRFIPARAGNARRSHPGKDPEPVHPRAGGERRLVGDRQPHANGSSPRGRGTHKQHRIESLSPRFIPARAGNAPRCLLRLSSAAVHPRAGGERRTSTGIPSCSAGSSPRGRGTPGARRLLMGDRRFIPARAGNASRSRRRTRQSPVHPRAGGERGTPLARRTWHAGSSPRGRGTLFLDERGLLRRRFIPARAGNAER